MSNIDHAHPGDQVHLVADVQNAEGKMVSFLIASAAGDELDKVTATVQSGTARAIWKADAKEHILPLAIKFFATIEDRTVESGRLMIDPPGIISAPAWLLLPSGGSAANGSPGELSVLPAGDDVVNEQSPHAHVPYRPFFPGDQVGLTVDVTGPDHRPLVGQFDVTFELQKEQTAGAGDFNTVKQFVRAVDASGGVSQVAARWTMDTMGLPPPYSFRFLVSWKRRPGEQQTPDDARSTVTSVPA